jgi:hypothetical protein
MLDASNNLREGDHQMHTTLPGKRSHTPTSEEASKQKPFTRVTPVLKTALLMGAGGGFVLATVLTLSHAFSIPLGARWEATAQAHGHLQLYAKLAGTSPPLRTRSPTSLSSDMESNQSDVCHVADPFPTHSRRGDCRGMDISTSTRSAGTNCSR